jgi:hypothetical protein
MWKKWKTWDKYYEKSMLRAFARSRAKKENIPMRKRKIIQLEKGKYSNEKKENIPIRKRKIFPNR